MIKSAIHSSDLFFFFFERLVRGKKVVVFKITG